MATATAAAARTNGAAAGRSSSSSSDAAPQAPQAAEPVKAFIGGINWHLDDEGLRKRESF